VLSIEELSKYYGSRAIFDRVSWSMADDDRVGLVGLNGAGKTTLLKIIAGIVPPDSGRINRPQRTRVGYLAQDTPEMGGRSLLAETLSALAEMLALDARRRELETILAHDQRGPEHDAALVELGDVMTELERHDFYTAESRAESLLFGLGFTPEDLSRDVGELSGGIRMRVGLAKLLLQQPEFLMLDEPTNHLDLEARNWLEEFLGQYPGGIILVSHDRYFLDRVTHKTVEVGRGRLTEYNGGYSAYLRQRDERFALEMAAYEKQREEIEHIENFVSRFRAQASKAKLVQSRIKQLERIERLEPPLGADKPPVIDFPPAVRSGRRVLELRGATKRYGTLTVYNGIDLVIERGARVALVGPNGAGKSTLMKMLAGVEPLSGGQLVVGHNVASGYFAQDLSEAIDPERRVLDELGDSARHLNDLQPRNLLAAMLFSGDDVYKRGGVLSGGEKGRLALAKVLAQPTNCLLLDEPTNNLDIVAKDSLLEALQRYQGTVVIVSHDRYVLNQLVTEVVEVGQGQAIRYLGNYDDYLAKKQQMETQVPVAAPPAARQVRAATGANLNGASGNGRRAPIDREAQRKAERAERARRELEASIENKETQRAALAGEMNDPNFYLARKDANEMIARYEQLGREIDKLYAELERLESARA